MNRKLFGRLFSLNLFLVFFGLIGHVFFFWVQENFYTQPNFLKPINDLLGNQTSATTYFVVLATTAEQMLIVLFVFKVLESVPFWIRVVGYYLAPVVPFVVYCVYEYKQMLNPTYPDNHVLDMVMAGLAMVTLWVVYTYIFVKAKTNEVLE